MEHGSLRERARRNGAFFGCAVGRPFWTGDDAYRALIARECNVLVAENAMKFGPIHPGPDEYAFGPVDELVAFAQVHDMRMRGHCLVWHQQTPAWLTGADCGRAAALDNLERHATAVLGRYRGKIAEWDVVNEAFADDCSLRDTWWRRQIGDDYLDHAFRIAHAADPSTLLYYNDYGAEGLSAKADRVYELARGMLDRGVPLHGVGLQCHFDLQQVRVADIDANIRRLAALGLQVAITELDIRIPIPATPELLGEQARAYGELFAMCLSHRACRSVLTWGITDRSSWVPGFFKGFGASLPFDETLGAKPAVAAIAKAIEGAGR